MPPIWTVNSYQVTRWLRSMAFAIEPKSWSGDANSIRTAWSPWMQEARVKHRGWCIKGPEAAVGPYCSSIVTLTNSSRVRRGNISAYM